MVATLPLQDSVSKTRWMGRRQDGRKQYEHCRKTQNTSDQNLHLPRLVQLPHHEDWKTGKQPVRDGIHGRGSVHDVRNDDRIDAALSLKRPPRRDRVALEDHDQGEGGAEQDSRNHEDAEDPDVGFLDGDAEEEESHRHLQEAGADDVEDLTPPPEL